MIYKCQIEKRTKHYILRKNFWSESVYYTSFIAFIYHENTNFCKIVRGPLRGHVLKLCDFIFLFHRSIFTHFCLHLYLKKNAVFLKKSKMGWACLYCLWILVPNSQRFVFTVLEPFLEPRMYMNFRRFVLFIYLFFFWNRL